MSRRQRLIPLADRGPLRVMFVITCMPVGGAETLLVNLARRMDRNRVLPELCCLKYFGPLGEELSREIPAFSGLLAHKYDFRVLRRLTNLLRARRIDAVITVGTGGDKMFWGRLAAWRAGVPVVASALHSTGMPDHVEWPNRLLAFRTDAFIAVAESHAEYLATREGCPPDKVRVIYNGVDVTRFRPLTPNESLRKRLRLPPGAPVATIVAALRPEKNHELLLRAAARVCAARNDAHFLVVGDGPRRPELEAQAHSLGITQSVHFLGTRSDVPELLALSDLFVLSSHMEANPVSILEAMACAKPVVAPRVGSIPETVREGINGTLVAAGDDVQLADRVLNLMQDPVRALQWGLAGRELVSKHWSLEQMVKGYEDLVSSIYQKKADAQAEHARRTSDASPGAHPASVANRAPSSSDR